VLIADELDPDGTGPMQFERRAAKSPGRRRSRRAWVPGGFRRCARL